MAKEDVLQILLDHEGEVVSGEKIGTKLNISRAAVWKSIKSLKEMGYDIVTVKNTGYIYRNDNGKINDTLILKYLTTEFLGRYMECFETIGSTNTHAKKEALKVPEGALFLAEEQTEGKGRFGRSFLSPKGSGVYMSMVLKPKAELAKLPFLTLISPLSVVKSLKNLYQIEAKIKWPNDVIFEGRKLCGISTDLSISAETLNAEYVVIGIGVNVKKTAYPKELQEKAINLESIIQVPVDRNRLAAEILNQLESYYRDDAYLLRRKEIVEEYKTYLSMLQQDVTVVQGERSFKARVLDVDENGELLVKKQDGETVCLTGGEVSIRGVYGFRG